MVEVAGVFDIEQIGAFEQPSPCWLLKTDFSLRGDVAHKILYNLRKKILAVVGVLLQFRTVKFKQTHVDLNYMAV